MEQAKEAIMCAVCELCHYPYSLTDQDALDDMCIQCPVEKVLETQLRAISTATVKEGDTE